MKKTLIVLGLLLLPLTALAAIIIPADGGTGISTTPNYGDMLVGDGAGIYTLMPTSSLGIWQNTPTITVNSGNKIGIGTTTPLGNMYIEYAITGPSGSYTDAYSWYNTSAGVLSGWYAKNIVGASIGTINNHFFSLIQNDNQVLTVTGGGTIPKVSIGTSTPTGSVVSSLESIRSGNTFPNIISMVSYSDTSTAGNVFLGYRSRGNTDSPGTTQAGDQIVAFGGLGKINNSYNSWDTGGAHVAIGMFAEENFSSTNKGTYMAFGTTPSGGTVRAERMRINSFGYLGIGTTSPFAQLSVNAPTGLSSFSVGSTTKTFFRIDPVGRIITDGYAASVSGCGTSASVSGTDRKGIITVGTGNITACTLNFASSYPAAPICTISTNSTSIIAGMTSLSTSSMDLGFSGDFDGGIVYYICEG